MQDLPTPTCFCRRSGRRSSWAVTLHARCTFPNRLIEVHASRFSGLQMPSTARYGGCRLPGNPFVENYALLHRGEGFRAVPLDPQKGRAAALVTSPLSSALDRQVFQLFQRPGAVCPGSLLVGLPTCARSTSGPRPDALRATSTKRPRRLPSCPRALEAPFAQVGRVVARLAARGVGRPRRCCRTKTHTDHDPPAWRANHKRIRTA